MDLDDGRIVLGVGHAPEEVDFARDPVCGMEVNKFEAGTGIFEGAAFYFCSPGCKERFEREPQRFVTVPRP